MGRLPSGRLELLQICMDQEVLKSTGNKKGDYKPLVFLMTDGQPTDSWEEAADRLRAERIGNIIACGAGLDADEDVLRRITDNVVTLNNLSPDAIKPFFNEPTPS